MHIDDLISAHIFDLGLSGFIGFLLAYGFYTGKIRLGSDFKALLKDMAELREDNKELQKQIDATNKKAMDKLERLEIMAEQERR